jgi:hypothetical protein
MSTTPDWPAFFLAPFALLIYALIILLPLLTAIWAYGDAERRGQVGCLVALFVYFVCWPFSLLLWLMLRPPERYYR